MPSGKVHFSMWKEYWFLPVISASILCIEGAIKQNIYMFVGAIGVLLGYALGAFIDPDLDLAGVTSAEGRALKIPVLGILFFAYWSIYGAAFRKSHRSFWTHSYFGSTVIRFVYQFWWVGLFESMPKFVLIILISMFMGLCISDAVHIWSDNQYGER